MRKVEAPLEVLLTAGLRMADWEPEEAQRGRKPDVRLLVENHSVLGEELNLAEERPSF
ncbi:MAG: hypothetical protein ABSB22_16355 [Thermodesulfobacteriota bacterium]|jgi:hypothetical protein